MTDGLKDAHRKAIIAKIAANHRIEKAVIFGSRPTGTNTVSSDVDIALFGDRLTMADQAGLTVELGKIPMEQSVKVVLYNSIRDQSLRDHIRRQGIRCYEYPQREKSSDTLTDPSHQQVRISMNLGQVCTKIGSGATPRGGKDVYLSNGPYALIRSQNVYNDGFRHNGLAYIGEQHALQLAAVEVLESDVLLNITGDSVARACQVDPQVLPARVNQHVAIVRPDSTKLDPGFLRYYLVSPKTQAKLLSWAGSGGTRNALTKRMIQSFDVVAPKSVTKQRAIAHILGTLDDKIRLNQQMNERLEALVSALFKSWFVKFDPVCAKIENRETGLSKAIGDKFPSRMVDSEMGMIPEGWEVKPLKDCMNLTMGQSPPGSTYNEQGEGLPFFQGRSDFGFRYPRNRRFCFAPSRIANAEDTLVSVRAPVGDINMAWETCCIGRGIAALKHRSGSSSFTYYSVRAIQHKLREYEHTGTVFGAINKGQFEALKVIDPDSTVVEYFDSFARDLDRYIRSNVSESRILSSLRDTLVPKLISGDVRVTNFRTLLEMDS